MADASYDAVIIGGGHHALIAGCYLQRAGLESAIFERAHELGGGTCSDELPLPGVVANPCAERTRVYTNPAYHDFNLFEKGLKYVFPKVCAGMVFDDETYFSTYPSWECVDPVTGKAEFSPQNVDRTMKEIARFSETDAEAFEILMEKYRKRWRKAFHEYLYNPPPPYGTKNALEELFDDPVNGIDPVWEHMSTWQAARELFDSEELRVFFMRAMPTSTGVCFPNAVPGVENIIHTLAVIFSWEPAAVLIGGTHVFAHALQRAFTELGGRFFVHHAVEKIIIENGMAKGGRLQDGTEIEARKLVVSNVAPAQTFLKLIGEEYISPQIARRLRNLDYDSAQIFHTFTLMHELPKYKAAHFPADPEYRPYTLNLGPKDERYQVDKYPYEMLSKGWSSRFYICTMSDSIWDKTRAPQGKHVIYAEEITVPYRYFSERQWLQIKKDFPDELIRQWQLYAPNMTEDNVVAVFVNSPLDVINRMPDYLEGGWAGVSRIGSQMGRFRPIPELSHYRTPIKNLYLSSSFTHPGPGQGRACSVNCFNTIAEDFGLEKVDKGRAEIGLGR